MKKSKKTIQDNVAKVLEVTAEMQGSLTFKDPVFLKIEGKFTGSLDTKGSLEVGEKAKVDASVNGEEVVISGKVTGNITAKSIKLTKTAVVYGDISTNYLDIDFGACFEGRSIMRSKSSDGIIKDVLSENELADYLQVDMQKLQQWLNQHKIPVESDSMNGRIFSKTKIDKWVLESQINA